MKHSTRMKGKVIRGKPGTPNKTLMKIAGHRERIWNTFYRKDLEGFDNFWNSTKADIPNAEDRLEYLDKLCPDCNAETIGLKGHKYCPKCIETKGDYSFRAQSKHYEKVMTSPTAKFELPR